MIVKKSVIYIFIALFSVFLSLQNSIIAGFDVYPDGSLAILLSIYGSDNRHDVVFLDCKNAQISSVELTQRGKMYLTVLESNCLITNEKKHCYIFNKNGQLVEEKTIDKHYNNKKRVEIDDIGEYVYVKNILGEEKIVYKQDEKENDVYILPHSYRVTKFYRGILFFVILLILTISSKFVFMKLRKAEHHKISD